MSTWLGGVKRQICHRSTGTSSARWFPRRFARQKGGGMMFSMKRLVTTLSPSTLVLTGVWSISFWPMLVVWT